MEEGGIWGGLPPDVPGEQLSDDVDSGVDADEESDRMALQGAGRRRLGPRAMRLVTSAKADVAGCIPSVNRCQFALLCTLFSIAFVHERAETGARVTSASRATPPNPRARTRADTRAWRASARRAATTGLLAHWVVWNVTAEVLVAYLRSGDGQWRSRLFDVEWDGWFPCNRLCKSRVFLALMPFGILLRDSPGVPAVADNAAWLIALRVPVVADDAGLIALRNACYVYAVLELLGDDGDPEDIKSATGNPVDGVFEVAADYARTFGIEDFLALENASPRDPTLTLLGNRRRQQNAALRAEGLGGEPMHRSWGRSIYVPDGPNHTDLLRRTIYALGMRRLDLAPRANTKEHRVWRAWWDGTVASKAEEIAERLVGDAIARQNLLAGIRVPDQYNWASARVDVRRELSTEKGVAETYKMYFDRMAVRGYLPEKPEELVARRQRQRIY